MKKISVTIISLIFFDNALAGGMGIALKDYSVRASKYLRPRKSKKKEMTESLQELERKLWGESFGDISKPDMKGLAGSGFDPLGIIVLNEIKKTL